MNFTSATSIATNTTLAIMDDDIKTSTEMCYEYDTEEIVKDIVETEKQWYSKSFNDLPPEYGLGFVFVFVTIIFLTVIVLPIVMAVKGE